MPMSEIVRDCSHLPFQKLIFDLTRKLVLRGNNMGHKYCHINVFKFHPHMLFNILM